jgi:hypothetical protein
MMRHFCLAAAAATATISLAPLAIAQPAVLLDGDDIGGVVSGPNGPEAGVWVIAETTDLPTRFARMVVTDDRGRYVVPDLPKANYTLWERGMDLSIQPKSRARRGKRST